MIVNSLVTDTSFKVIVAVNLTVASSAPLVTLAVFPSITIAVPSVTAHVITDPFSPASGRSKLAFTSSFNSNASLSASTTSWSVRVTTSYKCPTNEVAALSIVLALIVV